MTVFPAIEIYTSSEAVKVLASCTPQNKCSGNGKDNFCMYPGETLSTIPKEECILLGADLNGHVGQKRDDTSGCHGIHGFGICNDKGTRMLEFARER